MIWIDSDYQMLAADKGIKVDSSADIVIITAPPKIDASDIFYYIGVSGDNHVILNDKETGQPLSVFSGSGKFSILYCTGEDWIIVLTNTLP